MIEKKEYLAELSLVYRKTKQLSNKITSSKDAYQLFLQIFDCNTIDYQEAFYCMYFNNANQNLGFIKLSSGGITSTIIDIRTLFAVALQVGAVSIIVAHNHPSGTLNASHADKKLTEKIKNAGKTLDISLLDHIIVTSDNGFYSFADEGLI